MKISSYGRRLLILCFGLCALAFLSSTREVKAYNLDTFLLHITDIAVTVHWGRQYEDSENLYQIKDKIPILSDDNIYNISKEILEKTLPKEVKEKVNLIAAKRHHLDYPFVYSTYIVSLNFSVREVVIDGKAHLIGSVYVRTYRPNPNLNGADPKVNRSPFYPYSSGWQPVETFLITSNNKQTENNLRLAITRLIKSVAIPNGN